MKVENSRVFNFEGALRGMRNPKNSWNRSDSQYGLTLGYPALDTFHKMYRDVYGEEPNNYLEWMNQNVFIYTDKNGISEYALIGPKDMTLAQMLIAAGPEHRKFLRQILVSVNITAPLYFWKEFDTYKVATVANSTSTMHKLTSNPITSDCFEMDDYEGEYDGEIPEGLIERCEELRQKYIETKDMRYWKELIRWLPESWLQTRTITMNYETLRAMYGQRHNHKLTEWHTICGWIESLPYAKEFITYTGENK